jgi:LuxR family transcriptional regulator
VNIHSLLQLLVIIEECKVARNVVVELELVLRSYKFDFYGLLKQPKPNVELANFMLAGRWPEKWPLTYENKRYMLVDPVARHLSRAHAAVPLAGCPDGAEGQILIRQADGADDGRRPRNNGLEDGYIVPGPWTPRPARQHDRSAAMPVDLSSDGDFGLFDELSPEKRFWRLLEHARSAEVGNRWKAETKVDTKLTQAARWRR